MKLKYLIPSAALVIPLLVASQSHATPVDLGTAGDFAILAQSGVSATSGTTVVGDIGVSPSSASTITGFGLIMDPSGTFATSSLVTGKIYAADFAPPTPTYLTTAIGDMGTAYTDAAGRAAGVIELGAGDIGGMTLAPNVYKWSSGLSIPTDVTLLGGANDVWIFQIAGTLNTSSSTKVILSGGAQAKNIFWQVAGQATLGTTSQFKGIILGQTAIVISTGASLDGRALAQTAVTLDGVSVTAPVSCMNPADGDMNGSGVVDGLDIQPFTAAVLGTPSQTDICHGDFTNDGVLDTADIPGFVAALLAP